jgi:hypothetical protein
MDMIRRSGVITLAMFLVGVTASLAQKPAPPVSLSDTEQRTISSKIGSRYDHGRLSLVSAKVSTN